MLVEIYIEALLVDEEQRIGFWSCGLEAFQTTLQRFLRGTLFRNQGSEPMNRTWLVPSLFAVAGAIVLSGCDGGYFEPHPVMKADCQAQAGRVNADGVIELDDPVPCQNTIDRKGPRSFAITPEIEVLMRVIEDTEYLRDAGMWANCDPASTYQKKDASKCNAPAISIGVSEL